MRTPNMLVTHPYLTTDSFSLLIKSFMILNRVKNFNIRFRRNYREQLDEGPLDPRATPEFKELDDILERFLPSFPPAFRDPVGTKSAAKMDPILYLAHMIPHL